MKHLLVLGTHNRKKGLELLQLLEPWGMFELKTLADLPESIEVEETGTTFAENAALKASEQARRLGCWVLGEDSGLMVDALGGAPGVYSARFSGEDATDARNNALLLQRLEGVPFEKRTARYACFGALADPQGEIRLTNEGYCGGRIRTTEAGSGGFGYDPLFEVLEYHRTFGELGSTVKSCISHRGRAMRQMIPGIVALAQSGNW